MNFPDGYIFASLGLLGPLAIIAMWTDLRTMLIKNWTNGAFALIAAILIVIFMDLQTLGFHAVFAFVVMIILFLPTYYGKMGGGDWKMFGAVSLSLGFWDFATFGVFLAIATILVLILHRIVGKIVKPRDPEEKWASFHRPNHFPFGVTIGLTYLLYMTRLAALSI